MEDIWSFKNSDPISDIKEWMRIHRKNEENISNQEILNKKLNQFYENVKKFKEKEVLEK